MLQIANFAAADSDYGRRLAERVSAIVTASKAVSTAAAAPAAALNPPRAIPSKL